ncbi:ribonuclease III [Candidatus Parcubacteria bacterium]|nr:MAG: ribonuclease III [Candidatus Parcubacteria bacterium]
MQELQKKIGIQFKNTDLLEEALTHRSYLNEYPGVRPSHNERLEYLGDAVLELIVSEELFKKFPRSLEGQLTVFRAALVNYQMLGRIAQEIDLEKSIFMSKGESKDTGKAREVIVANAFEALIGAVYLDQGFEVARDFVRTFVLRHLDEVITKRSYKDAKSELQELAQEKLKVTPTYRLHEERGPAHRKTFKMGVYFGEDFVAEGEGASKQEAEVEAAKQALQKYKNGSLS